MTPKSRLLSFLFLSLHATLLAAADEAALKARVDELLGRMTLEEKIGQLVQYSNPHENTGPYSKTNVLQEIRSGYCGTMLNVVGARETREMQTIAMKETRLGVPLLFGYDVVHGFRTTFPMNIGQAASWDLESIEKSERIAAIEASAAGIHWAFAPMVDIARDPRWGRISEGSGEDTFLGSAIAAARVRGFQGTDLSRPDTVIACVKHFAAYGAAQAGRDYSTTDIPEITLRETYLPPYKAALDAGAGTVMAAFNDLNGVPCSANAFLMDQVLRREWGFKGFVVSDWASIAQLKSHGIAADGREAAKLALNAGLAIDMEGHEYRRHAVDLVKEGLVSREKIDGYVSSILRAKFQLGLFENPYRNCDEAREKAVLLAPEHLAFARAFARETFVLLKNERGALPLKKGKKIAVVGPLADSKRDLLGNWQARGDEGDAVSILTALGEVYPGDVSYAMGCQIQGDEKEGFPEALGLAREADVVVAVLGERWNMTGEGNCRTNLDLPGNQTALLEELHKAGKPVVLVLLSGRPLTLAGALPYADAVLYAWYPGTRGGPAVADVLSGAYSPSGKLPASFPRNVGQIPLFYNHKPTGRPQDEGRPREQFLSNYLDAPNSPEFPFGFGLSYTRFTLERAKLDADSLRPGGKLEISAELANVGEFDGAEVVQLYVRDVAGAVTRPVRELKGFSRVFLKKGEKARVSFSLAPADLAFYRSDLSYAPEAGRFEVFLGSDSTAPKIGEFALLEK